MAKRTKKSEVVSKTEALPPQLASATVTGGDAAEYRYKGANYPHTILIHGETGAFNPNEVSQEFIKNLVERNPRALDYFLIQ